MEKCKEKMESLFTAGRKEDKKEKSQSETSLGEVWKMAFSPFAFGTGRRASGNVKLERSGGLDYFPSPKRRVAIAASLCCCGTRFGCSNVKSKTSKETVKSLRKVLEPEADPQVVYTDKFLGIYQSLRRLILESLYVDTTPVRDQRYRRKSSAKSQRRHFYDSSTVRIGWTVVGRCDEMLLPFARHSGFIGWWENSFPTQIRTFLCERQSEALSIQQACPPRHLCWDMRHMREKLAK